MSVLTKCSDCGAYTCDVVSCFFYEEEVMSLFQCENCGCVENTATAWQGFSFMSDCFDWSGYHDLKGKKLCIVCGPDKFADGEPSGGGIWHDKFKRKFLPMGMFGTDQQGNLAHVETGDTDYNKYVLTNHKELNEGTE